MEKFPEYKKTDFESLLASSLGKKPSSLVDFDLDVEDVEEEKLFRQQKKAFRDEINALLDDEKDGDINAIALKLGAAWTKYECDLIVAGKRKGLSSSQTIKDAYDSLRQRHKKLADILKKVWKEGKVSLLPQEESFLVTHLKYDAEHFKNFISTCSLYDKCFFNRNKQVIQVAMDEFKKDIPFFIEWTNRESEFFINNEGETEPVKNMDHLLHNFVFAQAVLKNIPPETWTYGITNALGTWVVDQETEFSYIREFARKLEKCPRDKIKDYFEIIADLKDVNKKLLDGFSYKGLLVLLSQLKEEKAVHEATLFYEKNGDEVMGNETPKLTFEEWEKLAKFLSKTPMGVRQLMDASMKSENPLIWRLYAKGALDKEDLKRILTFSMKHDRRDFLMTKKPIHFSKDFPCYEELKRYFKEKSSAQGTRFFNSFSWQGDSVDTRCALFRDFIPSRAVRFFYYQNWHLLNHWAKEKNHYKILSFCYGENADTNPTPKSQIDAQNLKNLWLHQDENGKTPWHYICERKNMEDKIYFQRRFKELSALFLASCEIRDKDGKTPLDYALSDSKFMKNLLEKIPVVQNVLAKQGIQWNETRLERKKEITQPVKEEPKKVELAPAIPVQPVKSNAKIEAEEKTKITEAMDAALKKHQNLILLGRERDFALAYTVLKDAKADKIYYQDIVEHLQKFLATPQGQDFIIRGEMRWRPMKRMDGITINELAISPAGGNSEAMPRFYCKKELFAKQGKEYVITNQRQEEKKKSTQPPLTIWVATKKGDKRKQLSDAQTAQNMGFVNDGQPYTANKTINNLSWYTLDLSKTPTPLPVKKMVAQQVGAGR